MLLAQKLRFTKNQRGMTLIELLAVIVILGIIATIAGVAIFNASDRAKVSADATQISILKEAAQRYLMETDGSVGTPSAPTPITVANLLNGFITETPMDSAKNEFTRLEVSVGTDGAYVWKFYGKKGTATDVDFAPRAGN